MKCWCGAETRHGQPEWELYCERNEAHDPLSDGSPRQVRKLYCSGPMSGYPESNYPAFHDAARHLRGAGYEVANPAEVDNNLPTYTALIRADMRELLECDAVAVLEGWWGSKGARAEVSLAGVLMMPIRPLTEWLERARQEHQPQGAAYGNQ